MHKRLSGSTGNFGQKPEDVVLVKPFIQSYQAILMVLGDSRAISREAWGTIWFQEWSHILSVSQTLSFNQHIQPLTKVAPFSQPLPLHHWSFLYFYQFDIFHFYFIIFIPHIIWYNLSWGSLLENFWAMLHDHKQPIQPASPFLLVILFSLILPDAREDRSRDHQAMCWAG